MTFERFPLDDFLDYITDIKNKTGFRNSLTPEIDLVSHTGENWKIEVVNGAGPNIPLMQKGKVLDSQGNYVCGIRQVDTSIHLSTFPACELAYFTHRL